MLELLLKELENKGIIGKQNKVFSLTVTVLKHGGLIVVTIIVDSRSRWLCLPLTLSVPSSKCEFFLVLN